MHHTRDSCTPRDPTLGLGPRFGAPWSEGLRRGRSAPRRTAGWQPASSGSIACGSVQRNEIAALRGPPPGTLATDLARDVTRRTRRAHLVRTAPVLACS